jgi:hypothetical protein
MRFRYQIKTPAKVARCVRGFSDYDASRETIVSVSSQSLDASAESFAIAIGRAMLTFGWTAT